MESTRIEELQSLNIRLSEKNRHLSKMLEEQRKRIDEIQAYSANVTKLATKLRSVIEEMLPTLESPPPFNTDELIFRSAPIEQPNDEPPQIQPQKDATDDVAIEQNGM